MVSYLELFVLRWQSWGLTYHISRQHNSARAALLNSELMCFLALTYIESKSLFNSFYAHVHLFQWRVDLGVRFNQLFSGRTHPSILLGFLESLLTGQRPKLFVTYLRYLPNTSEDHLRIALFVKSLHNVSLIWEIESLRSIKNAWGKCYPNFCADREDDLKSIVLPQETTQPIRVFVIPQAAINNLLTNLCKSGK